MKDIKEIVFSAFLVVMSFSVFAQSDRITLIEERLINLSKVEAPGLKDKIEFSVSGVSIQEFLRGIAEAHELNISVDPTITVKIFNNFGNETVVNVILFLVRENELDIRFSGSIMSFVKYIPPITALDAYVAKDINAKFNSYTNSLSLDLSNDTLAAVVRKITQVSKKNIILSSGLSNAIINVYIEDMPFDAAMNKMAYANNLKVIKTEDNFYVLKSLAEGETGLSEPIVKVNPFLNPGSTTTTVNTAASAQSLIKVFINPDTTVKRNISLQSNNAPISDVIKAVANEAGIGYFMYSEIKGNTTVYIHGVTFQDLLAYLLQSTEYTFKVENGVFLIGDRRMEGLRAYKVMQLKYRSLDDVLAVIPAELKKGVEIKEFKELNSFLLTGSLPQIMEIEAFINEIDKIVPMVMIEVILIDVKKSRTIKTGISAGLSNDSIQTGGTFLPGFDLTLGSDALNNLLGKLGTNGALNIGTVTPNFYVTLSALENNQNVDVKSMPKLSTLNGHDATLTIGSTVYYAIETQNTLGSLTPNTIKTVQYQTVQANQNITIKPVVSGDDQVTLTIEVSISDFLPNSNSSGPPNIATSQFKSIIRVKNGEMVVLGGLERIEKSTATTGFPILSRLPILKWLFSNNTKSRSKTISIVFIKPTIIY